MISYLRTGLLSCYDDEGQVIDCRGTGQDAEFSPGLAWPDPRFERQGDVVLDRATGLAWSWEANPADFPLTWPEAFDFIAQMNKENRWGRKDWRLPNRRELRSLISYRQRRPALPQDHPFTHVALGWYWTSTTAAINPAYAWYVHTEGGRMFYGLKSQNYLIWPVSGSSRVLPVTGRKSVSDSQSRLTPNPNAGQDQGASYGRSWPEPRFEARSEVVLDRLSGLTWTRQADLTDGPTNWSGALDAANRLKLETFSGLDSWRLPTINELETLVDAGRHSPALPEGHPFNNVNQTYASSTTSGFEHDWCMVLHLQKGAVGVGRKKSNGFFTWAVSGPEAG